MNGRIQDVTAVVYKNLQRKYSLTEWKIDVGSASSSSNSNIEGLVKSLAEAYTSKTLGRLDAERPYLWTVRIVIENSLADDNSKDRFIVRTFRSLGQAERWLRSREREDGPIREDRPLLQCRRGLCDFNFDGGILHNHLYLRKIGYGVRNGKPYIKTIYLLDGD
jgi:hypothetical protein